MLVDADHDHDKLTRQSVTGIIILVNNAFIKWVSKRQKTVESSTYGSEMVASRIATEMVIAMRYNLRMLGVPVVGPTLMLGDNQSVVISTTMHGIERIEQEAQCNRIPPSKRGNCR